MKTLLLISLTTALISFNSFADTRSDIKNAANIMVEENFQQMNSKYSHHLKNDYKNSFNIPGITTNRSKPILLAKFTKKNSEQAKQTVQVVAE